MSKSDHWRQEVSEGRFVVDNYMIFEVFDVHIHIAAGGLVTFFFQCIIWQSREQ